MEDHVITQTTIVENVTLITILEVPDDIAKVSQIFRQIAQHGINIDMINQSVAYGGRLSLSFTVDSAFLSETLTAIATLKKDIPSIKTDVSSGNAKLIFFGEAMRKHPGVLAQVLAKLEQYEIQSKLITSSEVDISILVDENQIDKIRE